MDISRYPRQCLEELIKKTNSNPANKFNWFVQLKLHIFEPCTLLDLWKNITPDSILCISEIAIKKFASYLSGMLTAGTCRKVLLYPYLTLQPGIQKYLCKYHYFPKSLAQIRILKNHVVLFFMVKNLVPIQVLCVPSAI